MKPFDNKDIHEDEPIPVFHPVTHRFLSWLQEKKTTILVILSVLLALFLIILSFVWNRKEQKLEEIKTAYTLVEQLNRESFLGNTGKQEVDRGETIKKLTAIVQHDAELQKEFSGVIAQEMIVDKEKKLSPWAEHAVQVLNTLHAPHYASFSGASTAASEHNVADAYILASNLRLELEKNNKALALTHPSLYAYTLLHIASCAKALNQLTAKEEALTALKQFVHESLENSRVTDSVKKITTHFQENGGSITEFIEQLQ